MPSARPETPGLEDADHLHRMDIASTRASSP